MKMLSHSKVSLILSTFLLLSFAFNLSVLKPSLSEQLSCTDSNAQAHCVNVIFRQVENSVVQITRKIPNPTQMLNPQAQNNTALGSGFIYDKQGHIITNNHVVGDAKIVDVSFVDGNRYTAMVIGKDIFSDVAVLRIIENITEPLRPLIIGNSSELEIGEPVIAIGNPFGLSDTVTTGIISQVGRLLPDPVGFSIPNVIQTDAPINPGNSGGPLLNMQGQVVGINTAVFSSTGSFSGVGLAIPSNSITRIVPVLIQKGNYTHPYLGITGATLTSDLTKTINGLPDNFKGVLVNAIVKNGPADKAGIRGSTTDQYGKVHGGDIIVKVDGRPVIRMENLVTYLDERRSVNDTVTLSVYRNGHILDLRTVLQPRPSPIPYLQTQVPEVPP
jgi:S1-C subfamily serine protease